MTDTVGKKDPQEEIKKDKTDSGDLSGLGALLKAERGKMGLGLDRIAQITKLRQKFLEALENEDWDDLPPPVFVKGFIRSYARVLGLDEEKAIDLYRSISPVESETPRPLVEEKKTSKGPLFVLIIVLGIIAITIYLWHGLPLTRKADLQPERGIPPTSPGIVLSGSTLEQGLSSTTPNLLTQVEEDLKIDEALHDMEPESFPGDEHQLTGTSTEPVPSPEWLVLQGTVRQRTWVRINVDGQGPKEYIFQPGSRPQWKAKKGFKLIIGNASGIDFTLNGEKIEKLGDMGQVVSLTLPEGYEGIVLED